MKKRKLWIAIILLILCLIFTIFFFVQLVLWHIDSQNTKKEVSEILDVTTLEEQEGKRIVYADVTSTYQNEPFLNVEFSSLQEKNNEVVGWVQIPNTNIDYPFVKHNDNSFYLNHSFDKSYNQAGWPFLDYRNSNIFEDQNTIIYAHGRLDKTMFGSLRDTLNKNWWSDPSNYVVKVSTPSDNYVFEIFSVYHIKTTDDYLKTKILNGGEYQDFLTMLQNRSQVSFPAIITTKNRILTLSTCYNDEEKMVLHAKLIKQEKREGY